MSLGKSVLLPQQTKIRFLSWRQDQRVRTVFATTVKRNQVFFFVVLVVAVGVCQTINPGNTFFTVHVGVQRTKGAQQSMGSFQIDRQLLDDRLVHPKHRFGSWPPY